MNNKANKISAAQKQKIVAKYIGSPKGRQVLAQSMVNPLRHARDYTSVCRPLFLSEDLPDGALPYYDKDIDVRASVVAEDAASIEVTIRGERVLVPLFSIATNPQISIEQIKERRFDIIDRAQVKAKDYINRIEDDLAFKVLRSCADNNQSMNPTVMYNGSTNAVTVDPDGDGPAAAAAAGSTFFEALGEAFSHIEKHDLRVASVLMNGARYKEIRLAGRDILDFETQKTLLNVGYMGDLWGAQVRITRMLGMDEIVLVAEPEYLGIIPERIPLSIIPADRPEERKIGFSIFESIGMLAHNPKAIQFIKIT